MGEETETKEETEEAKTEETSDKEGSSEEKTEDTE